LTTDPAKPPRAKIPVTLSSSIDVTVPSTLIVLLELSVNATPRSMVTDPPEPTKTFAGCPALAVALSTPPILSFVIETSAAIEGAAATSADVARRSARIGKTRRGLSVILCDPWNSSVQGAVYGRAIV
jgi:hypothetical protein